MLLVATGASTGGGGFNPTTHTYNVAGNYAETIPTGATNLVIEVWGGDGGGGSGSYFAHQAYGGGGGGSGSYGRSASILVSGHSGQTIGVTVGAAGVGATYPSGIATPGGASSVQTGTFTITTISTNGGASGNNYTAGGLGGAGGAVGTGGSVNTAGNGATGGGQGFVGIGGAGIVGLRATGPNGGNGGSLSNGQPGSPGLIIFYYT